MRLVIISLLGIIIGFNLFYLIFRPDPINVAKIQMVSLSAGERYQGRLNLWRLLAENGNWQEAQSLEKGLNQADLTVIKAKYFPKEMSQQLEVLKNKAKKTVEDWLEVARIQVRLGHKTGALEGLLEAKKLDPIRSDIDKMYFELAF